MRPVNEVILSVGKKHSYEPKVFPVGALRAAIQSAASAALGWGVEAKLTVLDSLPDGTRQHRSDLDLSQLATLCDLNKQKGTYIVKLQVPAGLSPLLSQVGSLTLRAAPDGFLEFEYEADSADVLHALISAVEMHLDLSHAPDFKERLANAPHEPGENLWDAIDSLEQRLDRLEASRSDVSDLTCFLSFRFDAKSSAYAERVKTFLEMLGVKVITGLGYEPKTVSDKVRSRLAGPVDVIIALQTASGGSAWTRDEMAKAQQPGVFLIPLVENGSTFVAGIFGDHEYIEFAPDHIGDAFVSLLEGIGVIAREKSSVRRPHASA